MPEELKVAPLSFVDRARDGEDVQLLTLEALDRIVDGLDSILAAVIYFAASEETPADVRRYLER